jgi:LmbE family N-acetylglucosaminyl deacetylase
MIHESEWLSCLSGLSTWQPPSIPTLVIAPHPDDETLGAGGLIATLRARGVDVHVVAVTDGENAYEDGVDLAPVRQREQAEALALLGVEPDQITRLHLTDSGLAGSEDLLLALLLPLTSGEMHIIAPWTGDFHPDHEVCGRAAERVARQKQARLTSYFFWTWHRGKIDTLHGLPLVCFPIGEEQQRAKRSALLCHRSQLEHASGQPILPEYLLAPAYRPFEVYLPV